MICSLSIFTLQKKEQKLAQERSNQLGTSETKQLINGKNPERSDSPTSTSTATSVGTLTPPSHCKFIFNFELS